MSNDKPANLARLTRPSGTACMCGKIDICVLFIFTRGGRFVSLLDLLTYPIFASPFILLAYSMQNISIIPRSRKVSTQLLNLFPLFNFSNTQYSYSPLKASILLAHLILNTQYSSLILLFFHSVLTVRYSSLNTR